MHLSKPIKLDPRKSDFYFVHTEKKKKSQLFFLAIRFRVQMERIGGGRDIYFQNKKKVNIQKSSRFQIEIRPPFPSQFFFLKWSSQMV